LKVSTHKDSKTFQSLISPLEAPENTNLGVYAQLFKAVTSVL